MADLNQREKTMGVFILVIVIAFAHIWGAKQLAAANREKKIELSRLELQKKENDMAGTAVTAIEKDMAWLKKVEPEPLAYEDVQTKLQNFLASSSAGLGLETFGLKLLDRDEFDEEGFYQSVRIQISCQGDQSKILRWLPKIHQPAEFRAVIYMKLQPSKIEGEMVCHLIAEQWLVPEY